MSLFEDIESFVATLPPTRAVIGLDLGTKTIGVAVSDTWRSIATPLETIKRTKFGADAKEGIHRPFAIRRNQNERPGSWRVTR